MTVKVLVIDDQKPIMALFEYALRDRGCQVDWTPSGTHGLLKLAGGRYDVVFLDLNLGGGHDGVETLKQMHIAGSRVPVYIITGFYENYANSLTALVKQYGIEFGVLRKPIDLASLHGIINDLKQPTEVR